MTKIIIHLYTSISTDEIYVIGLFLHKWYWFYNPELVIPHVYTRVAEISFGVCLHELSKISISDLLFIILSKTTQPQSDWKKSVCKHQFSILSTGTDFQLELSLDFDWAFWHYDVLWLKPFYDLWALHSPLKMPPPSFTACLLWFPVLVLPHI